MTRQPDLRWWLARATAVSCTLLGAGCDGGVDPIPAALVVVSGNAQSTLPGGQVPRPLVVRAHDARGAARAGVLIRWSGNKGSSFASDTTRTDANGVARGVWFLGTTQGTYAAKAEADSGAQVSFSGATDASDIVVTAVPSTLQFTALDDTASIKIRVQSASANLDTLVDPRGWSSGANPVARPIYTATGRMVLRSERNGTSAQSVFFGQVPAPFTAVVKQVAVGVRIVRLGTDLLTPDTLVIAPDSTVQLGVVAADSRGRPVQDSSAMLGVTWQSTSASVATVEPGLASGTGVLRGIADGVSDIVATAASREVRAAVRVWTLRASVIAAGGGSTCALLDDNRLACWGFREVGNNSELNVALAPEIRPDGPFVALSMSEEGGCGLTASGSARCWGRNTFGQVGSGATGTYVATPAVVSGNLVFASIAAGPARNCGLTTAGRVYCWGVGYDGVLGDGTYGSISCQTFTCTPTPVEISGARTYTQLSVGSSHACAIATDGRAYCWGSNRYGQLGSTPVACAGYSGGSPTNSRCSTVPVEVDGNLRFKLLSAGVLHTCGITTDDGLRCWGSNLNAMVGVPTIPEGGNTINPQPLAVAADTRFKAVYSGRSHSCAIDTSNAAWCWGGNFAGQLGTGTAASGQCVNGSCERAPVRVAGSLSFKSLAIGGAHTCGMTTSDVAYCWGWAGSGALGIGSKVNQPTPVRVAFQR